MAHSTRLTLPPLHTRSLPRGNIQLPSIHDILYDLNEQDSQLHNSSAVPQLRQLPDSSPPAPCLRLRTNVPASTPTSTTTVPVRKIRLVHTSFENADAVLLIAPPPALDTPPPQPLLLVGPALQRLRQHQRPLVKGTRVHPYRIVRNPSDQRPPTRPADTNA